MSLPPPGFEHTVDVVAHSASQRIVAAEVPGRATRGAPCSARTNDFDPRSEGFEGLDDGLERAGFARFVTFDHSEIRASSLCFATALTNLDIVGARCRRGRHHTVGVHHGRRCLGRRSDRYERPVGTLDHEHANRHVTPLVSFPTA
jgi:hypothetical protein